MSNSVNSQSTSNITSDDAGFGGLEPQIHKVFASIRTSGSLQDFVYCEIGGLSSTLDRFCDADADEIKGTTLLVGENGSGKSTLLVNWLHHRKRVGGHLGGIDEFIFYHAVGCSRQSRDINSLLRRLIDELRARYQLARELPATQEQLPWELPRFLELAAKKGRILIVIDGVGRLQQKGEGGSETEAGLSWLPLQLPPNVRVILSVTDTVPDEPLENKEFGENSISPIPIIETKIQANENIISTDDNNNSKNGLNRILQELERRKFNKIYLKPIHAQLCRLIVDSYIRKSVQLEASPIVAGPFITSVDDDIDNSGNISGFLLFDNQINALVNHPAAKVPSFLRLFIRCAHYASVRGFSLWSIWNEWLKVDDVPSLFTRILESLENGCQRSRNQAQECVDKVIEAGGLPALKIAYGWHPSFKSKNDDRADLLLPQDFRTDVIDKLDENNEGIALDKNRDANTNDGQRNRGSVLQSLGDQQWIAMSEQASVRLEEGRVLCEKVFITSFLHFLILQNLIPSSKALEDLLADAHSDAKASGTGFLDTLLENFQNMQMEQKRIMDYSADANLADHKSILNDIKSFDDIVDDDDYGLDGDSVASDTNNSLSSEESAEGFDPLQPSKMITKVAKVKAVASFIYGNQGRKITAPGPKVISDPSEGITELPLYLRGGGNCEGFGQLLGNALSLLYVARHGLKESELWSMLAALKSQDQQVQENEKSNTKSAQDPTRNLIALCYAARGHLEDRWRAEDATQSGKISLYQLYIGMSRVHNTFKKADAIRVLELSGIISGADAFSSDRMMIDYIEVIRRIVKLEKAERLAAYRARNVPKYGAPVKTEENYEEFMTSTKIDEDGFGSLDDESWGDAEQGNENASLGPVLEESILSVLCALGVLYYPEHHVLLLPSDSDVFRNVIRSRYVDTRGGVSSWHGRLILFFQRQLNSMRRCEELLWHLQICRKWYALRDALVDLRTFNMMYGLRGEGDDGLKDEYMTYWLMITQGPLYVSDEAQKAAFIVAAKQQQGKGGISPEAAKLLSEIDTSAALGLTEKDKRKQLLKDQVAPFDIVEEFNRSIENWVSTTKPTTTEIHFMLTRISRFLADFSIKGPEPPPFVRNGVDMRALAAFGVNVLELRDPVDIQNGVELGDIFPTKLHSDRHFYYYIRWIWTQFPWLALDHAASASEKYNRNKKTNKNAAGKEAVLDANSIVEATTTNEVAIVTKSSKQGEHHFDRRYWEVKKSDPVVKLINRTESRKSSFIKKSMIPSKSYDSLDASIKHIQDAVVGVTKPPAKFRRTYEEEMTMLAGIPHSKHCLKTIRLQTLFPSLEADIKKKNAEILNDPKAYEAATSSLHLGGGGLPLLPTVDDELRQFADDESLANFNHNHGGGVPIASEDDAEFERELNRMGRLRALADKINALYKQRYDLCEELRRQVKQREEIDDEITAAAASGEAAIGALEERYLTMCTAVDQCKRLNKGYDTLIEILMRFPPHTPKQIASLEQNVVLVKQQVADLIRMRHMLYVDAEQQDLEKKKAINAKIKYYQQRRKETLNNKAKVRKGILPKHLVRELGYRRSAIGVWGSLATDSKSEFSELDEVREIAPTMKEFGTILAKRFSVQPGLSVASEEHKVEEPVQPRRDTVIYIDTPDHMLHKHISSKSRGHEDHSSVHSQGSISLNKSVRTAFTAKSDAIAVHRQTLHGQAVRAHKFKYDKEQLAHEVLKSLDPEKNRRDVLANARSVQASITMNYIKDHTGSISDDDFIYRYKSAQKLTETLHGHQLLADSKIAQLRSEHADLYATWSKNLLVGDTDVKAGKAADGESDARTLDNLIFSADIRLNSIQRKYQKSLQLINEVRTGVSHMMTLLGANIKILKLVYKSPEPKLKSDGDIINALTWAEECMMAVNETMTLASKPIQGMEETKPFLDRQIDLAVNAQDAFTREKDKPSYGKDKSKKKKEKKPNPKFNKGIRGGDIFITPAHAIVVKDEIARDRTFDESAERIQLQRDNRAEQQEQQLIALRSIDPAEGTSKFLKEALSTHESLAELRRSNALVNLKQGRNAGYGWVLEDLLKSKGPGLPKK